MKKLLVLFAFFFSYCAFASETQTSAVLDFEGDIIEGERKRPYLFIQTGGEASSLDSMLFFRDDFNDYHEVDKQRRPGFIPSRRR